MNNFTKVLNQFLVLVFCVTGLVQKAGAQSFQNGDVFIAVSNGQIQWRSSTGVLKQTLNTGLGGYTTGMAFDAPGNLYVTDFSANNISKFNRNGVLQGTFGSGYSTPESIIFDLSGNAYVGNLGNGIRKYNSSGTFLGTSYSGRVDWMDLSADQCTMLYTTEGNFIGRHDVCTNTSNPTFATGLGGEAFALRIRQNGEVLMANGDNILRISPTGAILQTYTIAGINSWFALNLNPDGTSFWSADINTANVYRIDIATGNVLTTFNTGTGSGTVFGLSVFGEFTVSVCADNVAPALASSSYACGATIQAPVGTPLNFTVTTSDENEGDVDTLRVSGLPAGANMSPTLPAFGNPVSSTFTWTPGIADVGNRIVTFLAIDKCGAQVRCSYTINVTNVNTGDYYSKSSGDLHNVLTWGVNMDGSGANPPDFGSGKTFHLVNRVPTYTMTANWTVGGRIDIPAGSQLRINGFTLSEAGLIGSGTLFGSLTSNLIVTGTAGGNAGALNFASSGGILNNLALNRTGVGASVNIVAPLNIHGVLTLTNGALSTGNNITLKSTSINTARVAPVTGSISGNVNVERYIPARRAWRIMSAPVGGTQKINAAWQEGATTSSANPNPNPGFGTNITEGSAANGFDHNPLVAMISIKRYISASDSWVPLGNTNATNVNSDAYLLFVRGHRGTPLGLNTVPATNTTLRATGPLKTGNQTFDVSANGFTAIPNPFASPINFATITRNNVQNNFYLWDPKRGGLEGVGGYVLVSSNGMGGYDITPAPVSPESQLIQSGQGFLVHSTGVAGSLVIKESDKSPTAATNVFRTTNTEAGAITQSNTTKGLRISLQMEDGHKTTAVLDEVIASYGRLFSDKIDEMDALKVPNINENLGIIRNHQSLMIERRQELSGNNNDTVYLQFWNTAQTNYLLVLSPLNLSSSAVASAFLEDNYLHTSTSVSLSEVTKVHFSIDGNPASVNKERFKVILKAKMLPGDISISSGIKLANNPIHGSAIGIQFINQPAGTYNISLFNNAGQKVYQGQVIHGGGSATQTLQVTSKIASGVYRVRVTGRDKKVTVAMPLLIK